MSHVPIPLSGGRRSLRAPFHVAVVLAVALVAVGCSTAVEPTTTTTTTTTTTVPPSTTSTTIAEVEVGVPDTTTTTTLPDRADPVRLVSEALDTDAEITTESKSSGSNNPAAGHVQWIPIGDNQAGPGEAGLVLMAAHLNKGEPFFNLVDDSPRDSQGKSDKGLVVGDTVDFILEDDTVCRYKVIPPLGQLVEGVTRITDQPAIYFPKDGEIMNPILRELLTLAGDRPLVMMWVSYGGPDANEWKPNGRNRRNNAVVFSELVSCGSSEF
ncbi:MAG: hypothetical protein M5U23_05610 [Acidimicrobiia bacterium]|nr:hypothetical protein [Acidimicrobiia bacterium]